MDKPTPDGLMYQVISQIEEMNHVAARLDVVSLAVFRTSIFESASIYTCGAGLPANGFVSLRSLQ